MGTRHVYSTDSMAVIVGATPLSGFSGDEAFTAELDNDEMEWVAGADGNGQFVRSKQSSAVITITLESGSTGNSVLQALRLTGEPFPVIGKNNSNTSTMVVADAVVVAKPPAVRMGRTVQESVWTLKAGKCELIFSGAKEY